MPLFLGHETPLRSYFYLVIDIHHQARVRLGRGGRLHHGWMRNVCDNAIVYSSMLKIFFRIVCCFTVSVCVAGAGGVVGVEEPGQQEKEHQDTQPEWLRNLT